MTTHNKCKVLYISLISYFISSQVFDEELLASLSEEDLSTLKTAISNQDQDLSLNNNNAAQDKALENLTPEEQELALMKASLEKFFKEEQFNRKFGFDYVKTLPTSVSAEAEIPVSGQYILSFGDQMQVTLSGSLQKTISSTIGLDGSILFPNIGKIQAAGESFTSFKKKLNSLVKNTYVGVNSDVSITSLALKKISIVGAVNSSGSFSVNPFTTISGSLAFSSGLEDYASLRNVTLKRGNGVEIVYDLYDLLVYGDRVEDITLQNGDTLIVPPTRQFVEIEGEVNRPMIYEYKEDDSIRDLINFSMGFTALADTTKIYVNYRDGSSIKTKKVVLDDEISNIQLTLLSVGSTSELDNSFIKVSGNSVSNGFFDPAEYVDVQSLISKLTFGNDIYPYFAVLVKEELGGIINSYDVFSIADPNSYSSFKLSPNSKLIFFSRDDVISSQDYLKSIKLKIDGTTEDLEVTSEILEKIAQIEKDLQSTMEVLKPEIKGISSPFTDLVNRENIKILSFADQTLMIPLAGRISPNMINSYFFTTNDPRGTSVTVQSRAETKVISADKSLDSDDLIHILFQEPSSNLISVTIEGYLGNPGTYLVDSGTSLNDLYKIAGNITSRGSKTSIVLSRESIKEREKASIEASRSVLLDAVISQLANTRNSSLGDVSSLISIIRLAEDIDYLGRLTGDLSPESDNASEIILEEGDYIYVPAIASSVTIVGEVLQPITTAYSPEYTVIDYINLAGRYNSYADKQNIFIIDAGGRAKPINQGYFEDILYPNPGDTIVVPRDLDRLDALPLITSATSVISNIAFAAASLNALK